MNWKVLYHPLVREDLKKFEQSNLTKIFKAIEKVSQNPLPFYKGGFGEPLGNHTFNLNGYFKIKLLKVGIRIIYSINEKDHIMKILAIGCRTKESVYNVAGKRLLEK